jgi:ferritin
MLIKENILKELNKQINEEMYSSYLYLSMAAYFENLNLGGFAHWMRKQTSEEYGHAMKFYDYIVDRDSKVHLDTIQAPKTEWASPLNVFEESLKHEQHITGRINGLVELAKNEKDNATFSMLQWFVNEQVEEEKNVIEIIEKLKMLGDTQGLLLFMDAELAKRQ